MRLVLAVNTGLAVAVLVAAAGGCAKKEVDPIDEIKSMVPVIEHQLNRRDLAGLKGRGTVAFESNAFVIDVFGEHVRDTISLSLVRVHIDGTDATLVLSLASRQRAGERRQMILYLKGDGKWKIDRYEFMDSQSDSLNLDTARGV